WPRRTGRAGSRGSSIRPGSRFNGVACMPISICSLRRTLVTAAAALATLLALLPPAANAERVKDIAGVAGVRGNQLVGYGLVVGLNGTGDQTSQTPFTVQAIKNMLAQLGVLVPDNVNPQLRNVAAVTVHATLPPFATPGQRIGVPVPA